MIFKINLRVISCTLLNTIFTDLDLEETFRDLASSLVKEEKQNAFHSPTFRPFGYFDSFVF